VACVVTDESNSEFRLSAAVTGIPEIGEVIEQLVTNQMCCGKQTCDKVTLKKSQHGRHVGAPDELVEAEVRAAIQQAKAAAKAARAQARAARAQARAEAAQARAQGAADQAEARQPDKPTPPAPPAPPAAPRVTTPSAAPQAPDAPEVEAPSPTDAEERYARADEEVLNAMWKKAAISILGTLIPLLR